MAEQLWASSDTALWKEHLDAAYERVGRLGRPGLLELERWYVEELPQAVCDRDVKHITSEELAKLAYVDVLPSSAVKDTSTSAFASLDKSGKTDPEGSLKAAMNAMTVLKGVGPATASAVLSAGDATVPFMSDEALAVLGGTKAYTLKKYMELAGELRAKADALATSDCAWVAKDVERALFSAAAEHMQPRAAAGQASPGAKRKR